jgi:putative DNA primase/helicase
MLRAYIVADRPKPLQPLGGFEDWSRLVREPLVWLGEADPVNTIEKAREDDPQRLQLEAVLTQWDTVDWNTAVGTNRVSVKQVIEAALKTDASASSGNRFLYPEFRLALMTVAGARGRIDTRRLGSWLRNRKGRVIGDRRIIIDGVLEGVARWRLQHKTDQGWE